jgi:hypothetical protein
MLHQKRREWLKGHDVTQQRFSIRQTDPTPKKDTLEDALAILIDAAVNRDKTISQNGATGILEYNGNIVRVSIKMGSQSLNFTGTVMAQKSLRSVLLQGKVLGKVKIPVGPIVIPKQLDFVSSGNTHLLKKQFKTIHAGRWRL